MASVGDHLNRDVRRRQKFWRFFLPGITVPVSRSRTRSVHVLTTFTFLSILYPPTQLRVGMLGACTTSTLHIQPHQEVRHFSCTNQLCQRSSCQIGNGRIRKGGLTRAGLELSAASAHVMQNRAHGIALRRLTGIRLRHASQKP